MDIREQKSRRSITNAFIELRTHKELKKITVVELCKKAEVNKSTFYSHYHDIYDLSDQLENEVVREIIASIRHADSILTDTDFFVRELFHAYMQKNPAIQAIFSGSRSSFLPHKLKESILQLISKEHPEYKDNPQINIMLSFKIYGGFYAYVENKKYGTEILVDEIAKLSNS